MKYKALKQEGIIERQELVLNIVKKCMNLKDVHCSVNKDTIIIDVNNGWKTLRYEAFHSDEVMSKYHGNGFVPLLRLDSEIDKEINN